MRSTKRRRLSGSEQRQSAANGGIQRTAATTSSAGNRRILQLLYLGIATILVGDERVAEHAAWSCLPLRVEGARLPERTSQRDSGPYFLNTPSRSSERVSRGRRAMNICDPSGIVSIGRFVSAQFVQQCSLDQRRTSASAAWATLCKLK